MHELPDTARAVAKELMGPASPVGVRALPQAARVPRAHPRLARAMVISCSTLAVGSEPVVTGVRLARRARCFAWGVQPRPQTVVPVGGGKDSRRQVAESRLRWVFCDDAVRHNVPLRAPVQWPAW